MPELPEVEAFARYFAKHALKKRVARVVVRDERVLGVRAETLSRALRGAAFREVRRHGKHLFADAGRQWLHLHFGMSGELTAHEDPKAAPRFARVIFVFSDRTCLAFEDMRLFGVVDLTPSPEQYVEDHSLGPDPLTPRFTPRVFSELARGRRGAVKSLLMSQDVIAGVGNLYADETLYQCGVHPRRSVADLSGADLRVLHRILRGVLRTAVERRIQDRGLPPRWLFDHREEGKRCPQCGGSIQRTAVFGRTTYFCGKHQR